MPVESLPREAQTVLEETRAVLENFPQIAQQLQLFVREQADLEAWRKRRYGGEEWDEAKAIVAEAKRRAAEREMTREEAIEQFMETREAIRKELTAAEKA